MLRGLFSILVVALLASCGSSRYSDSYPLSGVTFRIRHGNISGAIPVGWTALSPRSGADSAGSLTLSSGDSLLIVFRPVDLDPAATAYFSKHGPADLAALTRTLHDSTAGTGRGGISTFSSGERKFAAYEVGKGASKMRVVVFAAGSTYYQCEARADRPLAAGKSYDGLFSAQQSVLRSIR